MLAITWVCELTLSNVNFMKSKYSILAENLASKLRNRVSIEPFDDLVWKKGKISQYFLSSDYISKW